MAVRENHEAEMRLTFLVPNDHASGGMRAVHEYSRHLDALGHDVEIVVARIRLPPNDPGRRLTRFQRFERRVKDATRPLRHFLGTTHRIGPGASLRVLVASCRRRRSATSCLRAHTGLRHIAGIGVPDIAPADALIVYDWSTALAARALPPDCGRKFYLVQADEGLCGVPSDLVAASFRLPYRRIVVSSSLGRILEEQYGVSSEGPVINGVDFEQFHYTGDDGGRLRRLGMVYFTAPYKASLVGLRAVQIARREFPALGLVLFGRDVPSFRLPARTRFRYDPPQDQLGRIYSSCAIWLSPSLVEGSGMPVQEAMACGCAVVATDVGGVRDFATDGRNVCIVPPGDAEALARQIIALLRDDALRQRISAAAARDIRVCTWERATAQLEDILQRQVDE